MPGPQFRDHDDSLEESALRELIAEILMGDYRDRNDLGLTHSIAFVKAKALLELREALRHRSP